MITVLFLARNSRTSIDVVPYHGSKSMIRFVIILYVSDEFFSAIDAELYGSVPY